MILVPLTGQVPRRNHQASNWFYPTEYQAEIIDDLSESLYADTVFRGRLRRVWVVCQQLLSVGRVGRDPSLDGGDPSLAQEERAQSLWLFPNFKGGAYIVLYVCAIGVRAGGSLGRIHKERCMRHPCDNRSRPSGP